VRQVHKQMATVGGV